MRVIGRMTGNQDGSTAKITRNCQAVLDQQRSDALPVKKRLYAQRPKGYDFCNTAIRAKDLPGTVIKQGSFRRRCARKCSLVRVRPGNSIVSNASKIRRSTKGLSSGTSSRRMTSENAFCIGKPGLWKKDSKAISIGSRRCYRQSGNLVRNRGNGPAAPPLPARNCCSWGNERIQLEAHSAFAW